MGRGISILVMRAVQVVRPRSSTMSMEWMHRVRPSLTAVQVAVTTPETAGRTWVALMSTPTATRFSPPCTPAESDSEGLGEDHVGAAVQQADGLGVAGDGHGCDGAFCGEFLELNAHGGDELA